MSKNHFALKCFLNWLIGQLVFLGRVSRDFTIWTSMWHLRCSFYPRVLQWVHIITKKSYKLHFIQKILFGATPTLKFGRNGQKPNFWQEGRRDSIFFTKMTAFEFWNDHFALKCFLDGLIDQIMIFNPFLQNERFGHISETPCLF